VRFCLYRNPDTKNKFKGIPVRRMENFVKEDLFESNLAGEEFDVITTLVDYLTGTMGVNGVSFSAGDKDFYLEKVIPEDNTVGLD